MARQVEPEHFANLPAGRVQHEWRTIADIGLSGAQLARHRQRVLVGRERVLVHPPAARALIPDRGHEVNGSCTVRERPRIVEVPQQTGVAGDDPPPRMTSAAHFPFGVSITIDANGNSLVDAGDGLITARCDPDVAVIVSTSMRPSAAAGAAMKTPVFVRHPLALFAAALLVAQPAHSSTEEEV